MNTYTGNLYTVPTDATVNSAVEKAPSSLTADQAATFKSELGASAKAPNQAGTFEASQGYADTTAGIQNAVENANLWNRGNDVASLSTALSPFEGANATAGDKTLDSILLSQTPGAYKQIQAATAPASGLQDQLATGTNTADTALQNAIAADQAATGAANGSAQKFVTGLNGTLEQYLAQAQNDANAYNTSVNSLSGQEALLQPETSALQNAISAYNSMVASAGNGQNGSASGAPENFSGLSQINYGQAAGIPSIVGQPPISELGTSQNYSDIAALQNLVGDAAFGGLGSSISPTTANQAGTYVSPTTRIPTLQELLSPVESSVGAGVGNNGAVIGSTPVLGQQSVVDPFNSVQSAYDALLKSIGIIQGNGMPTTGPVIAPAPPGTIGIPGGGGAGVS